MDYLYPYAAKEQQDSRMPYPFVEYKGRDFIHAYRHSRENFLGPSASGNLNLDLLSTTPLPADSSRIRQELALGEVSTLRLLAAAGYDEELLKGLRRKAELRKLKNKYSGEELRNVDALDADLEVYCRLAWALSDHHTSTRSLQSLSTLLKVDDYILSRQERAYAVSGKLGAGTTYPALQRELEAVRNLYQSLQERPIKEYLLGAEGISSRKETIPPLGFLVQDKPRARAYLQAMLKAGYKPHSALILQEENSLEEGLDKAVDEMEFFNPAESVLETLQREDIPYRKIPAQRFNEPAVISALGQAEEEYHVFSGLGILKEEILSTGKKLIHIHPGRLPEYRGSTTFLYSLLAEGKCAATGFIMNKGIDAGDIIASRKFQPPAPDMDISRIYDPYIRSQVLVDVVRQLADKGTLVGERQKSGGETYYMIHPVLRTLAIGYQRGELDTFNLGL